MNLKNKLEKTLYINDLQDVDAELYNSMKWVLENRVEDMGFVFRFILLKKLSYLIKLNE